MADILAKQLCWTLTEPHLGMQNQAIGLAEALGIPFAVKNIRSQIFWKFLPPPLWPQPLNLNITGQSFGPPWPDMVISCGRRSVAAALAIRQANGSKTMLIHIQNPQTNCQAFDVVIVPYHDRLQGRNVIKTLGALHRVTSAKIADTLLTHEALQALPPPRVAVLVGGGTKRQQVQPAQIEILTHKLVSAAQIAGASLMVTPSRRTGAANLAALQLGLQSVPHYIWDGQGVNPYFEMLKLADFIVVTGESVSMVSEACATGKPVYVHEFYPDRKLKSFHAELQRRGITRVFDGALATWHYPPLNETQLVADMIKTRWQVRA